MNYSQDSVNVSYPGSIKLDLSNITTVFLNMKKMRLLDDFNTDTSFKIFLEDK